MKVAPKPANEAGRLAALERYEVLDSSPEESFDRITSLAAQVADTPIALVSLVDSARQWFKSHHGIDATETPRDLAFCAHAILQEGVFVVLDSEKDERFYDNPLVVEEPHVRFYAGAPLVTSDGFALGTLCVIDSEARKELPDQTVSFLNELAKVVVRELELRRASHELAREVAARRQAQAKLEEQARDLERSNQSLEGFAFMASHDLQEPLRMVTSYTGLLASRFGDVLGDDGREFVAFAMDGAKRMQALIENLLEFSRVSVGELELQTTESAELLDTALWNLSSRIEEAGAQVEYGDLPVIRGNTVQLQQLFQNVIGNAIKYRGEETPHVEISATRERELWHFTVSDNGIGIDAEQHDRIFEMFRRLHGRSEFSGTGLGLAICKTIVERHGGSIWVESAPGSGSRFHFTLPADQGSESVVCAEAADR